MNLWPIYILISYQVFFLSLPKFCAMGIRNCLPITRLPDRNNFIIRIICLSLNIYLSSGVDTLSANQTLSGDQTLVSLGQNFELGFFKPGNSSNYYIGMWYKKVATTPPTIAWVANREIPISNRYSSELKIIDGNLVLLNESKTPIWSTNVNSSTPNSVVAVLLEDGNLVLRDRRSNSNSIEPIWQSFDYPAHTWLPGGKIAYNNRTGRKQLLTSWKNTEDPAVGLFSLELDANNKQYIIKWNGSVQYWTSGSWNGEIFSLVPEMRLNYIYNFSYVVNENESYFTYSLYNPSIISRFIMDVSGQVQQFTWLESTQEWNLFWAQPRQPCEVYRLCGAFGTCNQNSLPFCNCLTDFSPTSESDWNLSDYSGGCMRKTNLQCGNTSRGNGEKDGFLVNSYKGLPDNSESVAVGSDEECKSTCLNNCYCTAYSYDSTGCSIWNGHLLNLKQLSNGDGSGRTIYIRLNKSDISSLKNNIKKLAAGIISAFLGLVVICGIGFISYRRRMTRRQGSRDCSNRGNSGLYMYDVATQANYLLDPGRLKEDDKKGIDVPLFEFKSISAATDDFSDANKIGQGGFGPVYKGKLHGGIEIAVKRLSTHSRQGFKQFKNEVLLIAKLQHRNLVRLMGYCMKGPEMIILYEYLPNKSLDRFIFDRTRCMLLDWTIRFDIILGIARGLLYLHQDSHFRIIHRDLKTSNILLDEDMNPKISDFGLAKILVKGNEMEATTKKVIGTYGYMSPEYAFKGLFSVKSDVFSFGVVVLEIISGRKNTGFYQSEQALSLLGYAWNLWKEEKPLDLMDKALVESCNSIEVLRCMIVGLLCVQEDPDDRPTMPNVVLMLGSDITSLPDPKEPAFVEKERPSCSPFFNNLDSQTCNGLTISVEEGR